MKKHHRRLCAVAAMFAAAAVLVGGAFTAILGRSWGLFAILTIAALFGILLRAALLATPVQVRAPGLHWVFGEHGCFQLLVEGSSFGQPVDQDNAESVIAELFPEAKLVRLANIRYPGDEVIFEYPDER
jgi:hypothetical protein